MMESPFRGLQNPAYRPADIFLVSDKDPRLSGAEMFWLVLPQRHLPEKFAVRSKNNFYRWHIEQTSTLSGQMDGLFVLLVGQALKLIVSILFAWLKLFMPYIPQANKTYGFASTYLNLLQRIILPRKGHL